MKIPKYYAFFLIAIILFLNLPRLFAPDHVFVNWYTTDDAFYYFKVAQNVASGQGFTFDGIASTNGFHPLWMFILIPIFSLPGKIIPLRVLYLLLVLLNLSTSLLIFLFLSKRKFSPNIAFIASLTFSLLPQYYMLSTHSGIESGLSMFFIILFLYLLAEHPDKAWTLSFTGAGLLFSRLDNVFLVYGAGLWLLLRLKSWKKENFEIFFKTAFQYYTPISLLLLIYMGWNKLAFGNFMPVSGQIKRWWGILPYTVYGKPVSTPNQFFTEFFSDNSNIGPWALITKPYYQITQTLTTATGINPGWLLLVFIIFISWITRKQWKWLGATLVTSMLPLLFAANIAQILYYKILGSVAQRFWYWNSEMIFILLFAAILLETIWRQASNQYPLLKQRQSFPLIILSALCIYWLAPPHLIRFRNWHNIPQMPYLETVEFITSNTQVGDLIGMNAAGSTGYFIEDRTIVNIDGLISSTEYFIHLQNSTAHLYFDEIGLDYVMGNPTIIENSNPYHWIFLDRLIVEAEKEHRRLWHYITP